MGCEFIVPDSLVMSDEYLELFAKWSSDITDQASILHLAGVWTEMITYCDSILEILRPGRFPNDVHG